MSDMLQLVARIENSRCDSTSGIVA